ncbi:MAG: branched-chain amino acid ABC transporter permease [Thermodesulfovibrionales bacterium]|nr:branched-chain amino acid ABC transporter permease [Thermodesulfovibrionales bacterium]
MSGDIAYLVSIAPQFLILSMAALAQSLMTGYAGITFVASAAFMGLGAYTSAILSLQYKMPLFLSAPIAVIVTAVSGVIVSVSLKNIRKDYLAIGTLGLGLILNEVYLNWESVTNGALGITGIPDIPGQNVILTISLICTLAIVLLLTRSSFGNLIRAIRDDEILVQSLGKSTFLPRTAVYAVSFAFLGLAGAYFGHYLTQVDPTSFGLNDSIAILTIVIIGGIENPFGAILGAAVFVYLPAILKLWGLPPDLAAQARTGLFGLILIVIMMFRPQGLLGSYRIK